MKMGHTRLFTVGLLLFFVFYFLINAISKNNFFVNYKTKLPVYKNNNIENIVLDSLEKDSDRQTWIKDSLGCLHLRNLKLCNKLIKRYNLLNRSKKDFTIVFGAPNRIKARQDKCILIYYINSLCYNGMIVDGSDKTYIELYFRQDTLIEIPSFITIE